MDPHARNAYMAELAWQCQIAVTSFTALKAELAARKVAAESLRHFVGGKSGLLDAQDKERADELLGQAQGRTIRSLMYLQSFLAAVGIVSEIFWPNTTRGTQAERRARETRGKYLRDWGGLRDDSPLHFAAGRANDIRGGLLHIDEMIDSAVSVAPGKRVSRFDIGHFDELEEWTASDTVRSLDEKSLVFTVRARASNLRDIDIEVNRVFNRVVGVSHVRLVGRPHLTGGQPNVFFSSGTSGEGLPGLDP